MRGDHPKTELQKSLQAKCGMHFRIGSTQYFEVLSIPALMNMTACAPETR
jgi:hypothetical protein